MSRWSDYVHVRGKDEVAEMWAAGSEAGRSVYIVGEGFDPRMLVGLEHAAESGVFGEVGIISLGLAPPGGTSERAQAAGRNVERLSALAAKRGLTHERIPCPPVHERRALSRPLLSAIVAKDLFRDASQIVVDISALPVGIYFGLIKGLLSMFDSSEIDAQLQVCVAENVEIDRSIAGTGGVETPAPMLGFTFGVELDPDAQRPTLVWAPVLGEGATAQIEELAERLRADEICPVLPFPARNPRRADDLLLEMRNLLVDRLEVEPSNYIYADERNPFDLYRALSRLQARYRDALSPVGDSAVVLSLHSSKSLSLGALLAAYEHQLPALNTEPGHYGFTTSGDAEEMAASSELSGVWLVGMPTR